MPNLMIVDPCYSPEIEQTVLAIAAHQGLVYMRLLRGNVPLVLDEYGYKFEIGNPARAPEPDYSIALCVGLSDSGQRDFDG
jgi:transketolase C-terminal domain/subunit